jgi:hypothetical protein
MEDSTIEDYKILVSSLKEKVNKLEQHIEKQRLGTAALHKAHEAEILKNKNILNTSTPMDKNAYDSRITILKQQNASLRALLSVAKNDLEKYDLVKYSYIHGDYKTLSGEVKTFSGFIRKETTATIIVLVYSMKHQLFYNYCIKKEIIGSFKIYNINETKKTLDYHKLMDFIKKEKEIEKEFDLAWKDT